MTTVDRPNAIPVAPLSVRKRFAFTVAANLSRSLLSFVTGLLVARWLGPDEYGNMAFLLGTFVGLRILLDLGTSTAFFTFLSQRPRSRRFVWLYYGWLGVQFALPLIVMAAMPSAWVGTIWRGQPRGLVLLAFAATFMQNSAWPVVQQVGEAQRKTVLVQAIGVVVVMIHLAAVCALWLTGVLGLSSLFLLFAIEYFLGGLVAQRGFTFAASTDAQDEPRPLVAKYLAYCGPLIPYAAMGFAQEFADRWLLQKFGGGIAQAFYAIGAQFAAIALLATSSILRILWKEVAEAHHRQDHERAHRLYQRVSRLLFLVGATVAGFLMPWSADLLRRLLGSAYVGGAATLAIMFLYPVHQSMGQIGITTLYATERVKLQAIIGMATMTAAVVVSYFLLAPPTARVPGLGLGSEGLAVKMVAVQLVSVNVIAFFIARIWNQPFDWLYQPVSLGACIAMGWFVHFAVRSVMGVSVPLVIPMAAAGLLYVVLLGAFVYALPWTAGLTRVELVGDVRKGIALGRAALTRPTR